MPFEYAVRPFQSRDNFGRTIIPSSPSGHERATLTWGAKTDLKNVRVNQTSPNVICCTEQQTQSVDSAFPSKWGNSYGVDQVWGPGTDGPPIPHGEYGAQIFQKQTLGVSLKKKHQDACAAEWTQMSGVASAVENAFATLQADIEAGGSGAKIDHCSSRMGLFYVNGWAVEMENSVSASFPRPAPSFPSASFANLGGAEIYQFDNKPWNF